MNTAVALEQILHSPRLPEYAEIIARQLAAERLNRDRFYVEIQDGEKAEFIDGQVVPHSPARLRHMTACQHLLVLMDQVARKRGGLVLAEKALCVFSRNDYEPDIVYFGPEKAAGLVPDTMKFPVPDMIVEVLSESTATRDRGVKFEDYAVHGVREYWIVEPNAEEVEQYLVAGDGEYRLELKSADGQIASRVLDGLAIPIRAIFDPHANAQALHELLGSSPRA